MNVGPVHNKTGERDRVGGRKECRRTVWKSVQARVIRRATREPLPPPPHPSIIRNPIKEFCEQMAISHRETRERETR